MARRDTTAAIDGPQIPGPAGDLRHKNTYVEVRKNPPAVGLTATKVNSGNRPQAGYPTNTNHRRNPNETDTTKRNHPPNQP